MPKEVFISVDEEASGDPVPDYSMLSIGACHVYDQSITKYIELKPINMNFVPRALATAGFNLEELMETGKDPKEAMEEFNEWVLDTTRPDAPVFVGFNAPFDWQMYNYYSRHFTGVNAFGINALDIKGYFMGKFNTSWSATSKRNMPKIFLSTGRHTHHALDDAIEQADIFAAIRAYPSNSLPQ